MKTSTHLSPMFSRQSPCARWIWPLLVVLAFCAGCTRSDSELTKIAQDREAMPIIKALLAYQKAKGNFPPEASVASDLAPYAPAGVKLNFTDWSIVGDEYKGWHYDRYDRSPGTWQMATRVGHDDYLTYRF